MNKTTNSVIPSQAERGYRSRHLREGPQPTYAELTRWYTQTVAALTQLEVKHDRLKDAFGQLQDVRAQLEAQRDVWRHVAVGSVVPRTY